MQLNEKSSQKFRDPKNMVLGIHSQCSVEGLTRHDDEILKCGLGSGEQKGPFPLLPEPVSQPLQEVTSGSCPF